MPFTVFATSIPIAFIDADVAKLWWVLLAAQPALLARLGIDAPAR